jgi:hypothetical protein
MIIKAEQAINMACPFQFDASGPGTCLGSGCMAWQWADREFEERTTDNIYRAEGMEHERPVGDPPRPEGDGWEKDGDEHSVGYHKSSSRRAEFGIGRGQRWRRKLVPQRGYCGRVGAHHW